MDRVRNMDGNRQRLIKEIARLLSRQPKQNYYLRVFDCLPSGERVLLSEDVCTDDTLQEDITIEVIYKSNQITGNGKDKILL